MPRYIQINPETGRIVSDSFLSEKVNYPHMISVDDDFEAGNKKYLNGQWVEYEPEIVEEEPTQLDTMEENQLIIMEAMAQQYEETLENRLADMEVQATIYETLLEMQGGI